jgi:RNA polymerase sigma-70 factor (ECF subfamily)
MGAEGDAVALMGRYCDGDSAAFHSLYSLVAPRLLGYLMGLIGERAAAEDLLQATFIKLHEAREIYVRGADPIPWMYTIAHRTCLDELRKRKRSRVKLTEDGATPEVMTADLSGMPEGTPSEDDGLSKVTLAALEQLPHNQREALILTKVHGRTHQEAAAIAGTTPGAIKLRAHRAYIALRKIMGQREEER